MAYSSVDPATGETIRSFEFLSAAELEERLERSVAAFALHRHVPTGERAACLLRAADILVRDRDKYARIMTMEMGKTLRSAVQEAEKCAAGCRYYAENGERILWDAPLAAGGPGSVVAYQPLGPVLAIMPWNFPFWQVFRFAAPALMAGNTGLLKHAANVPQCALAIEEIFREAGFGAGVFQTLLISVDQTAAVLEDSRVAAVTLTGSEKAGSAVGAQAGRLIKPSVLELGGSDPFIVMPSANVERAVEAAVQSRCVNNGQSCIAAKRFIVHESIADRFEQAFIERISALRVGSPMDAATDIGPLATCDIRDALHAQVEATVAAGARLLTGGMKLDGPGNYYAPTVLTDIPRDSPAATEELFGPVASIFRVRDADEAISIANSTRYGLGASVWTGDRAEQERFAREIEAGMVYINTMVASDPRAPFGGVKRSGYGRELSEWGIRAFVNVKTIWVGQ